jgi:ribosomal protein L19
LSEIDPKGERKALFDYRRNPRSVKPGDIVRVTFKNGDPFNGVVLSIKMRGIDTSFLLRNELTRVAVEMSVKVFNPNISSVEIVQRAERKARRARLYFMRFVNPPRLRKLGFLLIFLLSIALASTTAAVSRTSWPPTFARRRPLWVVAAVVKANARRRRIAYPRLYYSLSILYFSRFNLSTQY